MKEDGDAIVEAGSDTPPPPPDLVQRLGFETSLSYPGCAGGDPVYVNSSPLCRQLVLTSTGLDPAPLAALMITVYQDVNDDVRAWPEFNNYPLIWSNKMADALLNRETPNRQTLDRLGLGPKSKGPDWVPNDVILVHEPTSAQQIEHIGLCTEGKSNKNGGYSSHNGTYFNVFRNTNATISVLKMTRLVDWKAYGKTHQGLAVFIRNTPISDILPPNLKGKLFEDELTATVPLSWTPVFVWLSDRYRDVESVEDGAGRASPTREEAQSVHEGGDGATDDARSGQAGDAQPGINILVPETPEPANENGSDDDVPSFW